MKSQILKAIVSSAVVLLVAFPGVGRSASIPGGITAGAVEKSFQPPPYQEPARLPEIKIEEEGVSKLEGGQLTFRLTAVAFEGNQVISSERLKSVIAGYLGQTIDVGKLTELADAVTAYYSRRGYFLTRAYLPPQTIKDGQVLVKVREGRLGEIIVRGNKRYSRDLIDNTLKIIREKGAVQTADVERGLLLLMDYPGLTVKATFKPGSQPATTDIVLDVVEDRFVGFSADFDNFGSRYVSMNRYGVSLDFNNISGMGDALNLRGVTGDYGLDDLYYARADYVIPLGYRGTKLGLKYSAMKYSLVQDLSVLNASGEAKGGGIWISHPLKRSRNVNWFVQGGFNFDDVTQNVSNQEIGKDKLRYATLGTMVQWIDVLDGSNTMGIRGYRSFEVLGSTEKGDPNTVRVKSDVIYSKLQMDLSRIQRLPAGFSFLLNGMGQLTGDRVPSSEQFHIGGAGTVRGYSQGERSGDTGIAATAELRIPLLGLQDYRVFGQPVREIFQFAAFYDYGKVWISDAEQYNEESISGLSMQGAGVGLRFNLAPMSRLKIDWAKSVGGVEPINATDKSRGIWTVQYVLSF